jgi:drug/metabolite transporter (DMT)-like permease
MTQLARTDQESLPQAPGIEVSRPGVGLLAAVAAAHLWAVSGVFGKIVMTGTLSPARLVFYRSVLSALMLLAILLWRDRSLLRLSRKDLPFFLAMGTLGLALTQFTYYAAIQSLSVGMAILLQYLAPLWMVLFERFWMKIPLTRARLGALTLALAGCAMVSVETESTRHWGSAGVLLGLTAGVCFAFYTLMTRHALKSHRDLTVLFYSFLFSALFWGVSPDSWQPLSQIESFKIWMILYVVIFGTILPYLLFMRAVKHLSASHTGIISTLEPVVAAVIAWIFLQENLTGLQLCGGLCVLLAIVILQKNTSNAEFQAGGGLPQRRQGAEASLRGRIPAGDDEA